MAIFNFSKIDEKEKLCNNNYIIIEEERNNDFEVISD